MNVSLDTFRRVYDDTTGHYIEVGPDADALGLVEIRTETTKENAEYWGAVRLAIPPEIALQLAEALKRCAEEAA